MRYARKAPEAAARSTSFTVQPSALPSAFTVSRGSGALAALPAAGPDPAVDGTAIGVAVAGGVVTLSGHLQTYAQKWAVQMALQRVAGAKAYALELDVLLAPNHRRSDMAPNLADRIRHALLRQAEREALRIKVQAHSNGTVTLRGTVHSWHERCAAEGTVRAAPGVRWVVNRMQIEEGVGE
jgi:osmotically-inducible protein OsmY